jgi:hypothetical protein
VGDDLLFDEITITLMRLGGEPVRPIEPGAQMLGDRALRGIDIEAAATAARCLVACASASLRLPLKVTWRVRHRPDPSGSRSYFKRQDLPRGEIAFHFFLPST